MRFALQHLKCRFCGRMLFPGDAPLQEPGPRGRPIYACDAACLEAARRAPPTADLPRILAHWLETDCYSVSGRVDPITLEVINGALVSICKEMAKTMERTAYSPVFYEGSDMTTALFDTSIDLIAQYEGIPAQMGSMKYGVLGGVRHIGVENLRPGDVILHNDSYRGTPHAPEFCMIKPIFWQGHIVAYAANIAHHTDVGGKAPGSMPGDATEIFQEGVIIPPVKLFEEGREDPKVWQMYLANVRTPFQTYGDAMAMYGSLVTAETRVLELIEHYGEEEFRFYAREVQKAAERVVRAGIRAIPNGLYRGGAVLDDDGVTTDDYPISVDVLVLDEDIFFDFRRSSRQARGPVNAPYGVTMGGLANAIFNLVDPHVSHNAGTFRPLHLIAPPGTVVNCDYPAALNGGNTETHNIVAESVLDALFDAMPERVPTNSGSTTTLITGGGYLEYGEPYNFIIWEGMGWGAFADQDGNSAITTWVGVGAKNFPAEVLETRQPWRVIRHALRLDSAGAGRRRSGLGVETEYEILVDDFELSSIANRGRVPARGRLGGDDGVLCEVRVRRDGLEISPRDLQPSIRSATKFSGLRLRRGDVLIVRSPGGGGYGPPRQRDRALVVEDLRQGYISVEAAVERYGLDRAEAEAIAARFTPPQPPPPSWLAPPVPAGATGGAR